MNAEIEQGIERRVAQAQRVHALKMAHKELATARAVVKRAIYQVGELDTVYRPDLEQLINRIEDSMWRVETGAREQGRPA